MSVELKYIIPYLPYDIIMFHTGTGKPFRGTNKKQKLTIDNFELMMFSTQRKPILRPISDLAPIQDDEINDSFLINIVNDTNQHCDAYDEWRDSYFDNPEPERILQAPYEVFEKLLQEHFDVFGLIPAGLAISIHDLK